MSVLSFTLILKVKVVIDPDDKIFIFIDLLNAGSIKSDKYKFGF